MVQENPTSILIVDGTNIETRCRQSFGRDDIHFGRFFSKVTTGTTLLHTYYFSAPYSRKSDRQLLAAQSGRFNALRSMPDTTLRLGRHQEREVRCRSCNYTYISYAEKGTDVGVAICLARCAIEKQADVLFLLAGDNDYVPALELGASLGVHLVLGAVIGPEEPEHKQLQAIGTMRAKCRRFLRLDAAFMDECWRSAKA